MINKIRKHNQRKQLRAEKDWKGGFIPLNPITKSDLELLLNVREQGVLEKWKQYYNMIMR